MHLPPVGTLQSPHPMNFAAIIIGLIVLALLAVSLGRLGKVKTKADYLVAGRSLSAFVLVFTLLSSWIGSGSLLGGAENAYKHGFAALWQAAGGWAGLLLILFVAPRARKFAQYTIPDLLETRYNQAARVLGVLAILLTYTAITSYQFIGGGDILHLIFPDVISAIGGRILLAAFVIAFTAIAGMSSVAYMDLFIGLLATATMCVALPILIHHAGGWHVIHSALPASHLQIFGDIHPFNGYFTGPILPDGTRERVSSAFELFLPTCLLLLGNQSMYQKFFSAKTQKDASRAVVGWIVGTVILETVIVALAVTGSAIFPTGEVHAFPREVLAYVGLHGFDPKPITTIVIGSAGAVESITTNSTYIPTTQSLLWLQLLGALLLGSIFAKVVSTANNYLFSPATNLINDIFVRYIKPQASNKQILIVSRLMVVLLGLWSLFQSLGTESVLKKALYAYTIYSAALTPVILAAFFWKRATAPAAVASIATGTVVTVTWDFIAPHMPTVIAERDAIFPALIASLLGLAVVSLLTPPPSASQLQPFEQV